MLHRLQPPYDKYLHHANRERTFTVQRSGPRCEPVQARQPTRLPPTVPGSVCVLVLLSLLDHEDVSGSIGSIWLIQFNLLVYQVPSITAYQSN